MDNSHHIRLSIPDRSYVSLAKKEIHKLAEEIGFSAYKVGEIDIIIAEITSNLIKHSKEGEILVKGLVKDGREGIEILSIDRGPGIGDLKFMMKDGISTAKTLGHGLGAIRRLSDDFDIYSILGWGTIVLSRVFRDEKVIAKDVLDIHALMVSKPGETFCGDGYKFLFKRNLCKILSVDGLGHGEEANKASVKAIEVFCKEEFSPVETIRIMHRGIRGTRGVVGMIYHIDTKNKSITFCGVGNVSGRIIGESKIRSCISYNGIIGHTIPGSINQNTMVWGSSDMLIICSDGVKSRWELDKFPNIVKHDGSIIASALYKEYNRGTDDLSILIVRGKTK